MTDPDVLAALMAAQDVVLEAPELGDRSARARRGLIRYRTIDALADALQKAGIDIREARRNRYRRAPHHQLHQGRPK
jgi:hypothetical protein